MRWGFVLVVAFGFAWLMTALLISRHAFSTAASRPIGILRLFAGGLMITGGFCFVAPVVINVAGPGWFPESIEWPVGQARGVIRLDDGRYVVPVPDAGRIQLYDSELTFLRGWNIEANGGAFKVVSPDGVLIEVFVSRLDLRYTYNTDGLLLTTEVSTTRLSQLPPGETVSVPTAWWFYPLANPFVAAIMAMIGIGTLLATGLKPPWSH